MTNSRRESLKLNPFGTVAAGAAIVLGSLGAALGDDVSQGMTNSLHATAGPVAHLWGVMFAAGGILKIYGLYWHRTTMEIPGLWMMCGGYAFYSITVVVGLGMHGLAAGVIAAALAIGCLIKVSIIMRAARHLQTLEREE
ncbi:hypothetical protein ACBJ59_61390 [Nonomuraea sp. MTCD27]|uniref:hypothetical protein n=1 Tax=Nonomuraea sp. MTCD27 TaxID=1676747 RepID=UPI0035BECD61